MKLKKMPIWRRILCIPEGVLFYLYALVMGTGLFFVFLWSALSGEVYLENNWDSWLFPFNFTKKKQPETPQDPFADAEAVDPAVFYICPTCNQRTPKKYEKAAED